MAAAVSTCQVNKTPISVQLFGCFRGCFGGTLRQRDTATREPWRRPVYLHRLGALVALLHLAAAIVYFYFRIRTTLTGSALDNPNYARLVLAVELLSAFSMILFSINLLCRTDLKVWRCPPTVLYQCCSALCAHCVILTASEASLCVCHWLLPTFATTLASLVVPSSNCSVSQVHFLLQAMSEPPNLPPNRFQHLRVHFLIVTYDEVRAAREFKPSLLHNHQHISSCGISRIQKALCLSEEAQHHAGPLPMIDMTSA